MAYALHLWVAGETVSASNLNQVTYSNWQESAVGKASAAGDLFYATGANALARLAKGSTGQYLIQGAASPQWTSRPKSHYVPLCFLREDDSGSYVKLHEGYFSFTSTNWPTGFTAYLTMVWKASFDSGTAKIALRDITASSDLWESTRSCPVAERRDRVSVSLVSGHNYQVWGKSAVPGQYIRCCEAYLEFIY